MGRLSPTLLSLFDVFALHSRYYQGCESHYTHLAACCSAGSPTNDTEFVCNRNTGNSGYVGYDWFKSGAPGSPGFDNTSR